MSASYLIKTKAAGASYVYGAGRARPARRWHTQDTAGSLELAKLVAAQRGIRSAGGREAAVFHRGRIVARLAIALAAILAVGCAPLGSSPRWTVQQDPNGLGYWAGPAGSELRFYPSAYANPVVNRAGGPAR